MFGLRDLMVICPVISHCPVSACVYSGLRFNLAKHFMTNYACGRAEGTSQTLRSVLRCGKCISLGVFQKFLDKVSETFMCICCQELVCSPVTLPCHHNVCLVSVHGGRRRFELMSFAVTNKCDSFYFSANETRGFEGID